VKCLYAPHVGGHQINGSVKDVVIYSAVATLANEQGADSLKSQGGIGVTPQLEIIFKRGHSSIPCHMSAGSVAAVGLSPAYFSKTFNGWLREPGMRLSTSKELSLERLGPKNCSSLYPGFNLTEGSASTI